jgi:hypothetical protein
MNFKTLLLVAALPGCALDMNGTQPTGESASDLATDAGPLVDAALREAASPTIVPVEAAAEAGPTVDASALNPFGKPANPAAFQGCLTTCLTGCCDPAGFCWDGSEDNACGVAGGACSDCAAYAGKCGKGGVCGP